MTEEITHHWDNEMGDTTCGYLKDTEAVSHKLEFVNCKKCLEILNVKGS